MIIKSSSNSIPRKSATVYEPIDSYVTAEIIWTGRDIEYDKIFTDLYNNKPIEGFVTYNYSEDYISLLDKIRKDIEVSSTIPNIMIYINKNVKPHDIFLKYFTVVKY